MFCFEAISLVISAVTEINRNMSRPVA